MLPRIVVPGASVLGMISVFTKHWLFFEVGNSVQILEILFPVNTDDCFCSISGKLYFFSCVICILLFRKSLSH